MISGQMPIYKYAQSHISIIFQHVSVIPVTIIRLPYNKNAINIQMTVQKCLIKPLHVTLHFSIVLRMICTPHPLLYG
jgi:hypothetical protein